MSVTFQKLCVRLSGNSNLPNLSSSIIGKGNSNSLCLIRCGLVRIILCCINRTQRIKNCLQIVRNCDLSGSIRCNSISFGCSRSKFLSKLLKTFDKTFREIFPVFISTKRREKPSAFFDNNFVNNAYFSEAASSSSSHLASSSSKAPISSRMTCLCLWSS